MKNNQKGFVEIFIFIGVLIVSAVVAGGSYYVYHRQYDNSMSVPINKQKSTDVVTTTKQETGHYYSQNPKGPTVNVNLKADVTTTVDCGSESCFQSKFASCQPATLSSDAGFAGFSYKIIGPASGGCKVTMKFIKNPNPDWVNKEMTCVLDNKLGLQQSTQNAMNGILNGSVVCSGSLYTILHSLKSN